MATVKSSGRAATKSSAARRRSAGVRRIPSPVVPSASTPSRPLDSRKATSGSTASSSSTSPPPASGVTAAARAPLSTTSTLRRRSRCRHEGRGGLPTRPFNPADGEYASTPGRTARLKLPIVSALRVERDGPLLRITLARPERRNAFDAELIRELTEAFDEVGDARAVVLAGDGESFCAGADVDWQRSAIDLSYEENVEDALRLYRMLEKIDACPAPVVGRVQGYALGGGSGLVCCTDVAVAAPDAVFGFSEVKLGIVPAVISPFVFPRIGTAAARRLFLTGERFDAETALRIGLVQELAPDLDAAIERVAGELLSAGPEATRAAKQLIRERPGGEEAARLAAKLRTSPEGQEGLRAFLDKRPAAWRSGSSS